MDIGQGELPTVEGAMDGTYLAEALARAGRPAPAGRIEIAPMTGGRQSLPVLSLRSSAGNHVVKTFPAQTWKDPLLGEGNIEVALWTSRVTRDLPAPLACPTIDLAWHDERREYWMLMDDVSDGIMDRGAYDLERLSWLADGVARLHARYWDRAADLAEVKLMTLDQNVRLVTEGVVALGGRRTPEGWVKASLDNIVVLRPMVPVLLNFLSPADADFFLDLAEHREPWQSRLAEGPFTLVHGDIRRANVGILGATNVSLFDWDMASFAPAALDLAWYWFLQVWCYQPNDGRDIVDREPLRQFYVDRLAAYVGNSFDRAAFERSWELAWLKVFVQLGFCLTDPLTGKPNPDEVAGVRRLVDRAFAEARRILDIHVG